MSEPILVLRGMQKRFGALKVTQDVDLEVRSGRIHALIGPNGAGKTTLIGQMMGQVVPDAGRVTLNGEDVTALPPHERARRGLARTFQISSLIPSFSALENAALAAQSCNPRPLRLFGRATRDQALNDKAMQALEAVGLGARADVPARDLAYGEQRALEIACALALEPRCVLFDEPLAGMGHEEAGRIIELLDGLRSRFGMLLVEHDMNAVFALADRVSVLVSGRIIASGRAEEVRNAPEVRTAYLGEDE